MRSVAVSLWRERFSPPHIFGVFSKLPLTFYRIVQFSVSGLRLPACLRSDGSPNHGWPDGLIWPALSSSVARLSPGQRRDGALTSLRSRPWRNWGWPWAVADIAGTSTSYHRCSRVGAYRERERQQAEGRGGLSHGDPVTVRDDISRIYRLTAGSPARSAYRTTASAGRSHSRIGRCDRAFRFGLSRCARSKVSSQVRSDLSVANPGDHLMPIQHRDS
jgi:hypothetical protein